MPKTQAMFRGVTAHWKKTTICSGLREEAVGLFPDQASFGGEHAPVLMQDPLHGEQEFAELRWPRRVVVDRYYMDIADHEPQHHRLTAHALGGDRLAGRSG